jgi:peptidoglycan/LPS O-acetylase OafA/YrhL
MKLDQRIEVLDLLRGIAATAVALKHFTNILEPGPILAVTSYGWLGVEVFFVISGFIIPYSLYKGGYQLHRFPVFVLKRIVRLDPPYIVTIALIILLGVLSWYLPVTKGNKVFSVSFTQVMLHFGYLNTYFHYEWLSDVFWTLAIEFQYYILIGLTFPLLVSKNLRLRYAALASLAALAFIIPTDALVFRFIFLFMMGIFAFQYRTKLIGWRECAVLITLAVICCLLRTGIPMTAAGTAAVLAILFVKVKSRPLIFLGAISYSLYLLHGPIGRRGLNLALRVTGAESELMKIVCIVFAMAVSIVAAYLMYKLIERPSQRLSAAIQYKDKRKAPAVTTEQAEQLNPAF